MQWSGLSIFGYQIHVSLKPMQWVVQESLYIYSLVQLGLNNKTLLICVKFLNNLSQNFINLKFESNKVYINIQYTLILHTVQFVWRENKICLFVYFVLSAKQWKFWIYNVYIWYNAWSKFEIFFSDLPKLHWYHQ